MLATRVIPTLLLHNRGLVKGSNFKNHKYVGDPVNAVKIFNDKEVDELVFLDISATRNNKPPNFELLADIASQAFMPFGYGGGLRTLSDIENIFKIGIEKAIINTACYSDLEIVKEACTIIGSQSIVGSIDVKKSFFNKHKVYVKAGTKEIKVDPVEYAKLLEDSGVGEILLTSIDKEGTRTGYDIELIKHVCAAVDVPVVCSGGAGSLNHLKEAQSAGASALAVGDMFVFHGKHKAVLITYPDYKDLEDLFNKVIYD